MTCKFCSKDIIRKKKCSTAKYCSLKCTHEDKKRRRDLDISKVDNFQGFGMPVIKRLVGNRQENRCDICKYSSWMDKPIMLILDHIDGNASNWNSSNLRMICSNCDAQTSTYKKRNVGNGRHSRKIRYQSGKSY
jgi:5-methylcytosine-specific restriction endonuclease McrA